MMVETSVGGAAFVVSANIPATIDLITGQAYNFDTSSFTSGQEITIRLQTRCIQTATSAITLSDPNSSTNYTNALIVTAP